MGKIVVLMVALFFTDPHKPTEIHSYITQDEPSCIETAKLLMQTPVKGVDDLEAACFVVSNQKANRVA